MYDVAVISNNVHHYLDNGKILLFLLVFVLIFVGGRGVGEKVDVY